MNKWFTFKLGGRLEVRDRNDDIGQFSPDLDTAHSDPVKEVAPQRGVPLTVDLGNR